MKAVNVVDLGGHPQTPRVWGARPTPVSIWGGTPKPPVFVGARPIPVSIWGAPPNPPCLWGARPTPVSIWGAPPNPPCLWGARPIPVSIWGGTPKPPVFGGARPTSVLSAGKLVQLSLARSVSCFRTKDSTSHRLSDAGPRSWQRIEPFPERSAPRRPDVEGIRSAATWRGSS